MPITGVVRTPAVFGGLPHLGARDTEFATATVPIGFDAVAQCGPRLLRIQLAQNLRAAGLSTLSARAPYASAQLPAEVRAAAAAHLSPLDLVRTPAPAIELRLLAPVATTFNPLEIAWTLELNLVRAWDSAIQLGQGHARTTPGTRLVVRPEALQAWVELDTAGAATTAAADAGALAALLAGAAGQDLLHAATAPLRSATGLRLSPRIAIAGSLPVDRVSPLALGTMRVVYAIRHGILSLCFTFGEDSAGSPGAVESFLGAGDFAHYLSREALEPVLRARWTLWPSLRDYVGDVGVEMPLHEGSDVIAEGFARVRVRLGDALRALDLAALESEHGDVLQLAFDEEVHLLALWYADGSEVKDLGELGTPATFPLLVNLAPFTPAPADELAGTPIRALLSSLLEPLALPMLERFAVEHVDGFISRALGAVVARWALPTLQDTTAEPETGLIAA